jgi:hypothetical protein
METEVRVDILSVRMTGTGTRLPSSLMITRVYDISFWPLVIGICCRTSGL